MLGQISLAKLGLGLGGILTTVGLGAYFAGYPTLNLIGFFYGIPLLLGGLALKTTELKPVPFSQPTAPEVLTLRNQQATDTQTKLRKDITRYRYGQSAHLDETLKRLGLASMDADLPILQGLREDATTGAYTLILEFDSPAVPLSTWQEKRERMEKYFGPNLKIELGQPAEHTVEVALIAVPQSASLQAE